MDTRLSWRMSGYTLGMEDVWIHIGYGGCLDTHWPWRMYGYTLAIHSLIKGHTIRWRECWHSIGQYVHVC